jgi:hypothetical protein
LILRRAGKILAAPASPGGAELVLPSHEVRAGQSIAASAKAIAADALDRELGGGALRGLCLISPADEEADAVELCVAAALDQSTPDESLAVREPWGFHSESEGTFTPGAARVLGLAAGTFTAIDLDGAVLPIAGPEAAPELPDVDASALLRPPSKSREAFLLGIGMTGGTAWMSGTIWGLAVAEVLKAQMALVLWVAGLVAVFALAAHGRPARRVAIGGALVLPMGLAVFVLAMLFGGADEAHVAFWLWVFGLGSLAVAVRRLGSVTPPNDEQRVRRRLAWAAAALVTLVAVFPPLRESLFKRGDPGAAEESAQTPRSPADD